jgi:hypothetical protein
MIKFNYINAIGTGIRGGIDTSSDINELRRGGRICTVHQSESNEMNALGTGIRAGIVAHE